MSARERILARVRGAVGRTLAPPPPFVPAERSADFADLCRLLVLAGGEAHGPFAPEALASRVAERCRTWSGGGRVLASDTAMTRLGDGPWRPIPRDTAPHAFADVSVAIFCGALGVAENGAVGLDGREASPRALPILCERLILLLDTSRIVTDMHAALARISGGALAHHHFTFIAGPSKTADIEGSLVLGAHGPRELAVFGVAR